MTKIKVHAPNRAFAGSVGTVRFEAGVASVDDDTPEMAYFRRRGYGIGKPAEPDPAPTVDARDFAEAVPFGSPLRDAAVDPQPSDFLPPTNAGEADPHGPLVVAPGIHGEGPAGIRPGETFVDDTDRQAAEETALATTVLVDGQPATSVAEAFDADLNMGPIGLSDPGSVEMGLRGAAEAASTPTDVADVPRETAAPTTPTTVKPAAPRKRAAKTTTSKTRAARPKGTTK